MLCQLQKHLGTRWCVAWRGEDKVGSRPGSQGSVHSHGAAVQAAAQPEPLVAGKKGPAL
jgi:hypothetical protein